MPKVKFTSALKRFYPQLTELEIEASTVSEIIEVLKDSYPKLPDYIVDEHGALRKHVNIFISNKMIKDREHLTDEVAGNDEVFIMQALSGG
ncbi:MAG: molybdenum cofactor biosynthesis protein MoaD [Bacteroidetes bacterium]|nr:MoaD/ThiS family protein [Bacteroidia bacterium]PCH68974.1 MAG: molybdenum cofactor biosynthesis protein MoaD [Bacteroidota bacterium]